MEIIKMRDGRLIVVEGDKVSIQYPDNLDSEISEIDTRLSEIPQFPPDDELLAWARENYPKMDYSREIFVLTSRKEYLEQVKQVAEGVK